MTTTPPPSTPAPDPAPTPAKAHQPQKRAAWLAALAALTVSLLSLVVAFTALANARAARDDAAATTGPPFEGTTAGTAAATDPIEPPTTGQPPPEDSPRESESPPQSFDPQATFTERYSAEVLNPQVTSSGTYLDLDEPRVVVDSSQADLVLDHGGFGNDPPYYDLQQSNVTAAEVGDPQATPDDCLERLRTSPLPPSIEVPAQRGTVLCILTSLTRAAEQGISQKLVVLHVSALGDEGRVTIEANAWDQPQ